MNTSSHMCCKSKFALVLAAFAISGQTIAATPASGSTGAPRPGAVDNSNKLASARGQITGIHADKPVYPSETTVSVTAQFKLGVIACAARLKINGNITGGMNVDAGSGPLVMQLPNIGKYPPGVFTLLVEGDPDSSLAPACKGEARGMFEVKLAV